MVQLDLIELADLVRPEQLVAEILRQNPQLPVPVPLEELARLAGITKIEAFASEGFEGALLANATKSEGAIFYSARGPRSRQRFTVGHELVAGVNYRVHGERPRFRLFFNEFVRVAGHDMEWEGSWPSKYLDSASDLPANV